MKNNIPLIFLPPRQTSRWNFLCILCKERVGSCITCSVKTCKTAYHVTCAFKRGLEMRAIIEDEEAEDVKKKKKKKNKKKNKKKKKEEGN